MSHFPHMHRRRDDEVDSTPPRPLTEEQLEWFSYESSRLANKVLWKYSKGALLGFALLFVGFLFNAQTNRNQSSDVREANDRARNAIVASGRVVAIDGCNRSYEERLKIRDVFLTSQSIVRARVRAGESLDPANDQRALDFYAEQLRAFALPDCRRAANIINDDPTRTVPYVEPWFEGNPNAPQSVFEKQKKG